MYSLTERNIRDAIVLFRRHETRSPLPIYYKTPDGETDAVMPYEQTDAVIGYLHAAHGIVEERPVVAPVSLLDMCTRSQCAKAVEAVMPLLVAAPESTANFCFNRGDWRAYGRKVYNALHEESTNA